MGYDSAGTLDLLFEKKEAFELRGTDKKQGDIDGKGNGKAGEEGGGEKKEFCKTTSGSSNWGRGKLGKTYLKI